MDSLGLLFSFFFFFTYTASSSHSCNPSTCDNREPVVRFPFRLQDRQAHRCGYPGFDLSCNNLSQTIISLPFSGDFIVTRIDYAIQSIFINDPDYCLPRRILSLDLYGSPFRAASPSTYIFLNCSSSELSEYTMYGALPLPCLSGDNYTVVAMTSESFSLYRPPSCGNVSMVSVLMGWSYWSSTDVIRRNELELTWGVPRCQACEFSEQICGFRSDTGLQIACSTRHNQGLPRSAKYGIIIGIGIPGLLCIIGLTCYKCNKIRNNSRRRHSDAEFSTTTLTPHLMITRAGLDGPTIESFPKTVLGESRRFPKPNDNTCSICLSEYLPKETLRTIPECNHYFHADCIDEWLRLNATCPVCRKSPESSSIVTPCSSMSISSPSTSS